MPCGGNALSASPGNNAAASVVRSAMNGTPIAKWTRQVRNTRSVDLKCNRTHSVSSGQPSITGVDSTSDCTPASRAS